MVTAAARSTAYCEACRAGHAGNATICPRCVHELARLLGEVPALLLELDVALTRQSRTGADNGGRKGVETPLPYDAAASEATDVLLAHTITRWAMDIWRSTQVLGDEPPTDPVAYLLLNLDRIKVRRWAAALLDEVRAAVENAKRTIDLAEDYLEAGRCTRCSLRLRGRPGDDEIACQRCGATYGLAERRKDMLAYAEDRLFTAKDTERLVDVFLRIGETDRVRKRVPAGSVRGWASRGELEPRGLTHDGKPTYRLGDVLDRALRSLVGAA